MNDFGKVLMVIGALLVAVGFLLWTGIGRGWLGKLPGDINYSRDNFSFSFPLVTCLLLSVVLSVLLWIFKK